MLPAQIASSTASRCAAHAAAASSSPAARACTSRASKAVCSTVIDLGTLNVTSVNGDVPPRLLARGEPQLGPAFGGRVRLGVQHPVVQLVLGGVPASGVSEGGRLVPARRVAEPLVARVEEPLVQRGHVLVVDEPAQAERLGAAAGPAARRLARGDGAGVVVLATGGHGVEQVGRRVPGGDRQHDGLPTAAAGGAPHHRIGMQRCVSLLFLLVVLRSCGRVCVLSGLKWRSSDEVAQAMARLFRFVAQGLGGRLVVRLAR